MSETCVISIANAKGGVGKSTVTMFLAAALAKQKKQKVLILDTDSQESISNWLKAEQKASPDAESLVTVEALDPKHVQMFLKKFGSDYDTVFIDIPRMTNSTSEAANIQILYYCDYILIPAVGSRLDVMSTAQFFNIIQDISKTKKKHDYEFQILGFLNRETNRRDNQDAKAALAEGYGINMMEASLRELKLFTAPSLLDSILDTKEGRDRFEPFFNEFCSKLKIK